jgi:glycosyltransferase involved in cell wall biosynthesis
MRFHVLGVPHTVTHKDYVACAFTQKVLKFGKMMTSLGHEVIHYGHEDSQLICSEHVTVTTKNDLEIAYGDYDWKSKMFKFDVTDHAYIVFTENTIRELQKRIRKFDFILPFFGVAHKPICDYFDKRWYIQVEPGIGYRDTFAPCKVYESYSLYHSLAGPEGLISPIGMNWYDAVIPNYFDSDDFTFSEDKEKYFLYLGRVAPLKGLELAFNVTKNIGAKLIVAGQMGDEITSFPSHVEYVGYADLEKRRELMSKAKAGFVPSMYNEPFGGVQIEMLFSGTPTITTDWGAFTENNIHGVTGYRCRTFEQFIWAAKNIGNIEPKHCRAWAENFTLDRIGKMYEEYFSGVYEFYKYQSWYKTDKNRMELDWLNKNYPSGK